MKINERWEELKEKSHANIQSEKGILNRQIRSIQTEGHFGDIKKMMTSGVSITNQKIKCTKSLCCMQSVEISINIIGFYTIDFRSLKVKRKKTLLNGKRDAFGMHPLFRALKNNY